MHTCVVFHAGHLDSCDSWDVDGGLPRREVFFFFYVVFCFESVCYEFIIYFLYFMNSCLDVYGI